MEEYFADTKNKGIFAVNPDILITTIWEKRKYTGGATSIARVNM